MGQAITLRNACLAYDRTTVLHEVSLDIAPGTLTALIGPNGSGKSTLLNAIAGLTEPTQGRIDVFDAPPRTQRRRIAYVQQRTEENKLLAISGWEVAAMGRYVHRGLLGRLRADDRRAIHEALERMDALELADKQLRELSGGQQQRLLVAQGLAQEADILLLDEPMTGLDTVSKARILDVVTQEKEAGRAVVMTTHDLADARHADQVVLLAGRVVAAGSPREVLTDDHLTQAYGRHPVLVARDLHVDDPHHTH